MLNLDINTILQICSVAALAGMMYQSVKGLRRDLERLESEVRDYRDLKADMAVVKNDIGSIKEMFVKFIKEAE